MNDISVKEVLGDIVIAAASIYAFDYFMRSMIEFTFDFGMRILG